MKIFWSRNPNGGLSQDVDWKPYDPNDPEYLEFDENLEIKKGLIHEERVNFWKDLMNYIKENEKVEDIQNGVASLEVNEK